MAKKSSATFNVDNIIERLVGMGGQPDSTTCNISESEVTTLLN